MDQKLNRRILTKTSGALAGGTTIGGHMAPAAAQNATLPATPQPGFSVAELPAGYQIEKVVDGLTYAAA